MDALKTLDAGLSSAALVNPAAFEVRGSNVVVVRSFLLMAQHTSASLQGFETSIGRCRSGTV